MENNFHDDGVSNQVNFFFLFQADCVPVYGADVRLLDRACGFTMPTGTRSTVMYSLGLFEAL